MAAELKELKECNAATIKLGPQGLSNTMITIVFTTVHYDVPLLLFLVKVRQSWRKLEKIR